MCLVGIGDIHGNRAALDDLLDQLAGQLQPRDTIVFLGDYIDRGPDTRGCIDRILQFRSEGPAQVVTLAGNHEDWLLRTLRDPTRHSWILGMEAFSTIESYSPQAARQLREAMQTLGPKLVTERCKLPYRAFFDKLPSEHLAFLTSLKSYHRVGQTVLAHAGVAPGGGPVEEQSRHTLLWGTYDFPHQYAGPDLVVYGHRNDAALDENGWPWPRFTNRAIGLDTISHGVLTALVLPESRILQSGRSGSA
jgi:serine/threonine protein phosphatase 1